MVKLPNIHPGEVLMEDFLLPLDISQYRLAKTIGVPQTRIPEIVQGRRRVTADTALLLSAAFGTTPRFWMNLQNDYDLEEAREHVGDKVAAIEAYQTSVVVEEVIAAIQQETKDDDIVAA